MTDPYALQAREAAIEAGAREWDDLRTSGLLWLINATTFHPRGFALGIVYHDGEAVGWRLEGDGTEPWSYGDEEIIKQRFRDAQAAFARQGGGDAGEARQGVSEQRRRDKGARAESVPICRDPEHRHAGCCDRWQPIGQASPCGPGCPVHPRGLAGHGSHASDAMASVIATGLENAARLIEAKGTKGS